MQGTQTIAKLPSLYNLILQSDMPFPQMHLLFASHYTEEMFFTSTTATRFTISFPMFMLMQDKTGWLSISNMDCPEVFYTLDDGHWVDPGRGHPPQAGLTQWPFI